MRIFNIILIAIIIIVVGLVLISAEDPTPVTGDEADEVAEDIVDFTVVTAEDTANTLEDFVDRLITTPQTDFIRVLLVVGGVVLLIAGWRVYDYIVIIAGFLIGASIVIALVPADNTFMLVAAFLVGGLIGAILSVILYYFAVFMIGAYIGIMLTSAVATTLSFTPVMPLALFAGAIIGGVVLVGLSFEFLVILSSVVGAQMLSLGLGLDFYWTILFAIVGIVIQFALMRNFKYDFRRRRTKRINLFPRVNFG